jgi:hypothetical protein
MAYRPDLVFHDGPVIEGGGGELFRADVAVESA